MKSLLAEILVNVATIGVLGWLASRWLQARLEASIRHEYDRALASIQTQLGLQQEIARKRIEVVAEVWAAISKFERAAFASASETAVALLRELKVAGVAGIPDELPLQSSELLRLLSQLPGIPLPDEAIARMQVTVEPSQTKLKSAAAELKDLMDGNRFWLGRELDRDLRTYAVNVRDAFAALEPSQEAMNAFAQRLRLLSEKREDATTILDKLWKPVSPPRAA